MGLNDSVGLPTGRSFGHSMGVCGIRLAVAADAGHKVFFAWVVFSAGLRMNSMKTWLVSLMEPLVGYSWTSWSK